MKTIFDTMKVFLLFVSCTVLFYFGLKWLDQNYDSFHKYDEPDGKAVKVFSQNDSKTSEDLGWPNRLLQFIRDGE
ncbi:YqzK family protein [Tuberibacillus sp. Marseille-P3662]|uniref:YqzK family protein n=1 Tax=Tuberibacillus sp. Marseille-P3662 TaxID=1965358 RepID=UPI000A1CA792|nr:YqzK family protein [Tuberibacillus sp. Marseille-P3662]